MKDFPKGSYVITTKDTQKNDSDYEVVAKGTVGKILSIVRADGKVLVRFNGIDNMVAVLAGDLNFKD